MIDPMSLSIGLGHDAGNGTIAYDPFRLAENGAGEEALLRQYYDIARNKPCFSQRDPYDLARWAMLSCWFRRENVLVRGEAPGWDVFQIHLKTRPKVLLSD